MSVGWTCPSVRNQDPLARMYGEKGGPCPGHKGPHRIMHTPRNNLKKYTNEELIEMAERLDAQAGEAQ